MGALACRDAALRGHAGRVPADRRRRAQRAAVLADRGDLPGRRRVLRHQRLRGAASQGVDVDAGCGRGLRTALAGAGGEWPTVMDDRPRYMISVAAELVGMHPQTLRMYEQKGLVLPKRTSGNTRLYSEADLERLRLIQRLTTQLGLNLAGVEAVLDLEEQLRRMRARLERLEHEMRDAIQQVHRQYRRELVLYDPSQLPVPRRWTSTS